MSAVAYRPMRSASSSAVLPNPCWPFGLLNSPFTTLKNSPDDFQALSGGLMPPSFPTLQGARINTHFLRHLSLRQTERPACGGEAIRE